MFPITSLGARGGVFLKGLLKRTSSARKPAPVRGLNTSPSDNLKVVPFVIKPAEAESLFQKHHEGWFTTSTALKGLKMERILIPFWVVRADMRVYLNSARLGFSYYSREFDFNSKQFRQVRRLRFEQREFGNAFIDTRRVDGTEAKAQLYASYRFRKEYVDGVRSPSIWTHSIPIKSVQMEPDVSADPFQMPARTAFERVIERLRAEEELKIDEMLRKETGAQEVHDLRLTIEVMPHGSGGPAEATPVYLSTYCFSGEYRGMTLRTFVNGATGEVGGQQIPQAERVGLLAGIGTSVIGLLTGAFWGSASGFLMWFCVPAVIAMMVARFWPVWVARLYEYRRQADAAKAAFEEMRGSATGGGGSWRPNGPQANRSQQGRQQQQQQADFQACTRARPSGDPKGYYAALGIKPTATVQEIQSAFRGKALQIHPDRVPPADKAKATAQFQKLTEAYSVLRDPGKRRAYDGR
ncbi:hypothetical protein DFJ77DRAFT_429017 [Powellomyces hirtus]|nr:hypothetical protein DFJ77DRAFT_429017 [Powellomyces hirtus]